MTSAIRARREAEDGFTLIELLVVVIIIGILAAIAIPAFLNQRERAWQSELTSTVRNVALEAEAAATTQGGDYADALGATAADVLASVDGFATDIQGAAADPVDFISATASSTAFTMCAQHTQITDTHSQSYDSANGGLQDYADGTAC